VITTKSSSLICPSCGIDFRPFGRGDTECYCANCVYGPHIEPDEALDLVRRYALTIAGLFASSQPDLARIKKLAKACGLHASDME